jgi:hypothetical protein
MRSAEGQHPVHKPPAVAEEESAGITVKRALKASNLSCLAPKARI